MKQVIKRFLGRHGDAQHTETVPEKQECEKPERDRKGRVIQKPKK